MAVIVHNTSYKINCPWLLDREQLLELDRIIAQHWESLLSYREHKIEEKVEAEINKRKKDVPYQATDDREKIRQHIEYLYDFKKTKNVTLFNSDGTQIKASDFASVIQHPDIEDRTVKGFRYSINCAEIECDLVLRSYNSDITLDVSPGTIEEARALFIAIKGWMNRAKAPLWQRIARGSFYGWWWSIFIFILIFSFGIFTKNISPEWQQIKHAHDLLKNGIDDNDIKDSVTTMLAIVSEYEKPNAHTEFSFPNWYICLLIAILFLCLILTFLPEIVLGIGKGELSIIWWRRWLHFISYTIPIVVLSSFVWPRITDWIKTFF
jgi:uncharacterized membrane protein YhaH (DUF805 family)